jgi:DNA gyrase subunit B
MHSAFPGKLHDCRRVGPGADTELFVVEGDSAANAVALLRNRECQAVLPMQGKPLNAMKAGERRVLSNPLFRAFGSALAVELGERFELAAVRYERILLLLDPDADGIHCGALLQMFLYRWIPALLASGRVLAVQAPVARVDLGGEEAPTFVRSEPQLAALIARERAANNQELRVNHFRGLAGIPANVLQRHCLDPGTRHTMQLGLADAEMAIRIFGAVDADAG